MYSKVLKRYRTRSSALRSECLAPVMSGTALPEGIDPVAVLPARRADADDHFGELVADGGDGLGILVKLPRARDVIEVVGRHDEQAIGPATDRTRGQVDQRHPDRRDVREAGGLQVLLPHPCERPSNTCPARARSQG